MKKVWLVLFSILIGIFIISCAKMSLTIEQADIIKKIEGEYCPYSTSALWMGSFIIKNQKVISLTTKKSNFIKDIVIINGKDRYAWFPNEKYLLINLNRPLKIAYNRPRIKKIYLPFYMPSEKSKDGWFEMTDFSYIGTSIAKK